jgi:hypothetical protein
VVPDPRKRSDEEIAATAIACLAWNVAVPPDCVLVKVSKGTITLTGEVGHRFQSKVAERELTQLYGVIAVDNRIVVRPQVDVEAVSDSISEALDRSWLFDPQTVTVTADGGTVHLGGTVRTMQERREAGGRGLGIARHHGGRELHQRGLSENAVPAGTASTGANLRSRKECHHDEASSRAWPVHGRRGYRYR